MVSKHFTFVLAFLLISFYHNCQTNNNDFDSIRKYSYYYFEKEDLTTSLRYFKKLINIHENNVKLDTNIYLDDYVMYIKNFYRLSFYNDCIRLSSKLLNKIEIWYGKNHIYYIWILDLKLSFFLEIGNNQKAIALIKESLELKSEIYGEDSYEFISSLHILGIIFQNNDKIALATDLFLDVLKKLKKINKKNDSLYFSTLNSLCAIYFEMGQLNKAKSFSDESFNAIKNNIILPTSLKLSIYQNRALIFTELKNKEEALKNFNYALELSKKTEIGFFKLNELIQSLFFSSIKLDRFDISDKIIKTFSSNKDFYSLASKGFAEEEVSYINSINYNDLLIFTNYSVFRFKENTFLTTQSFNNLLNYKTLSINVLQNVKREIKLNNDTILLKLFEEWKISKNQLAKLYELSENELLQKGIDIKKLEENTLLIEQELSRNLKSIKNIQSEYNWLNIQNKLKKDEVYIEFLYLPGFDFDKVEVKDSSRYIAYIIKAESTEPEFVLFENGRELNGELFEKYANNTFGNSKNNIDEASYISFWKPLDQKIKDKNTIYLALDGVFNKINFNTLYDPEKKKYLVETHEINYVTNTIDFINTKNSSESKTPNITNAILFGNPNFDFVPTSSKNEELTFISSISRDIPSFMVDSLTRGLNVKRLPETKKEVENIAQLLKNKNISTTSYLDIEATEENLKNCVSPSMLHIATHGYFFEDEKLIKDDKMKLMGYDKEKFRLNPMLRSGLLLSGANASLSGKQLDGAENGILTSYEASYLNLENTELVVLSACETGLGKIVNGTGVYGLRKSIKDAGAKNIIMSLWKVDDKITQEFMTTFYLNWFSGITIKEAFNKTQLEIKSKYPQPYYWGAFILSEF
jgi:CHAT domain-containing protein